MSEQISLVNYLSLGEKPHLVAHECTSCGARFFDRRNACASCSGTEFRAAAIATEGTVRTFTIVAFAAPNIEVPFVSAIVDCEGTSVRANIVNIEADPKNIKVDMPVKLLTLPIGKDDDGVEAMSFAFEPI